MTWLSESTRPRSSVGASRLATVEKLDNAAKYAGPGAVIAVEAVDGGPDGGRMGGHWAGGALGRTGAGQAGCRRRGRYRPAALPHGA